jgi:ABC-type sugar transport system permease subunit
MRGGEGRLALGLLLPALATIALVAVAPLLITAWESLHLHDLRMPWRGRPFVGLANYMEAVQDTRFLASVAHTAFFTVVTVTIELVLGLVFALALDRTFRGRGLARVAVLLPWAVPSVVAALVWRFLFEEGGLAGTISDGPTTWLAHPTLAWVPLVLADVWRTTPFVAILLLAGLQTVDRSLYEAARIDGAGSLRQLTEITLPLLAPALATAALFRTLDALRVFDLIYVLTGGGPGTATEPVSVYAFDALFRSLRFGYGSALSMLVFLGAFAAALLWIRITGVAPPRADATP